jgi:hypothetical protein
LAAGIERVSRMFWRGLIIDSPKSKTYYIGASKGVKPLERRCFIIPS